MLQRSFVGLEDARRKLVGGEAKTRDIGQPMDIAVVDNGGSMVALQPLYGIQVSNRGCVVVFPGGIPLEHGDPCIGAIGVSGGENQQHQAVTEVAAAAL